jgi:inorganic pyrophosphatase
MIYGIALGYKSAIIPVLVLALVVYGSFTMCDMYGVSLAAIGFLSNLATGLTIDVYGPVCDNAGGKYKVFASITCFFVLHRAQSVIRNNRYC